jgi:N-hydroxyarylamine O-acetyltransferase
VTVGSVRAVSGLDVAAYLDRLGIAHPGPPSVAGLRALHAAHVERVPYETFDHYLGRPPGLDPYASADRIARLRRGGYCYHLNGAMSVLLAALGYRVTRHLAGVHADPAKAAPGADGNHLGLTVEGLAAPECPEGRWLVDVGLGDALHQPLPLRAGRYRQGPFTYTLGPSRLAPGGWRLDHDPRGSFVGVDFAAEPSTMDAFESWHGWLSSAPESPFVRTPTAQRRDSAGVDIIRGCVFTRITADGGHRRLFTSRDEWFELLAERFGLTFDDLDDPTRTALWARMLARHRAHEAAAR